MREIVIDTETTGFDPHAGHRIIEIGCVELMNYVPTGQSRQWYINPQRDVPADAQRVHGITDEMLVGKPLFAEIVEDFLAFTQDTRLVAHNMAFDLNFLNAELGWCGHAPIGKDRTVDTLEIARKTFPGARASLDALCQRFGIDLTKRSVHGALLDAELLAEVYLHLNGGRQTGLALGSRTSGSLEPPGGTTTHHARPHRVARPHQATPEEGIAHRALLARLKNPIWMT